MFGFDDLEELLERFYIPMGTAESHGFLTGYLCVSDTISEDMLLEYFLSDIDNKSISLPECVSAFKTLAEDIHEQLSDQEFGFQMLLPDDRYSIIERSASLAEWCQGFLSGLGIVGQTNWQALSAQCHDIIGDFYKICRLSADEDQDDEDSEASLTEISEYVRMGVLYIYDEFSLLNTEQEPPEVIH